LNLNCWYSTRPCWCSYGGYGAYAWRVCWWLYS